MLMGKKSPVLHRAKAKSLLTSLLVTLKAMFKHVNYTATGELNHVSYNFTHLSGHGQGY